MTALAATLGVSRKHLSNVLNGRAPLVEPLAHRLASAAEVDPVLLEPPSVCRAAFRWRGTAP